MNKTAFRGIDPNITSELNKSTIAKHFRKSFIRSEVKDPYQNSEITC